MTSLLYSDVVWKLLDDKWHAFGKARFWWFTTLKLLAVSLLTLSLCQNEGAPHFKRDPPTMLLVAEGPVTNPSQAGRLEES